MYIDSTSHAKSEAATFAIRSGRRKTQRVSISTIVIHLDDNGIGIYRFACSAKANYRATTTTLFAFGAI